MGAGRPRKYTKKSLQRAVDGYFDSICRTVDALDDDGSPMLNDAGEPIRVVEYVRPPSVGGLCLYLGIDRSTWQNYADRKLHPELAETAAYAKVRMEAYLEEQLLTREKNVQGLIFNLQNNYGWREKREVELGGETRRTVEAHTRTERMSIAEKMALLDQTRAAVSAMAGTDDGGAEADEGPGG